MVSRFLASLGALTLLAACPTPEAPAPVDTAPEDTDPGVKNVEIQFEAVFGNETFDCGSEYRYIGLTSDANVRPSDFRMFIQDMRFKENGIDNYVEVMLDEGSDFQDGSVALLDFESGDRQCEGGSVALNTTVTGTVLDLDYESVAFTIGVPFNRNHVPDPSTAPPPLNTTSMWRDQLQGYYFMKLEMATNGDPDTFPVYINSKGCQVSQGQVSECYMENRNVIELAGFDPETQVIKLDLYELLSKSRVSTNAETESGIQTPSGCQSDPIDPDCQDLFVSYGLSAIPQEWVTARDKFDTCLLYTSPSPRDRG